MNQRVRDMSVRNLFDVEEMSEKLTEAAIGEIWDEADALIDETFYSYEEVVKNCVRMDETGDVEVVLNEESHMSLYTIKEDAVETFKGKFKDIVNDKIDSLAKSQIESMLNDLEVEFADAGEFLQGQTL